MKKLYLLSGMMVLAAVASINADVKYLGGITEEQAQEIEKVQTGKVTKQRTLARPAVYKTLDTLISEFKKKTDWPAVFAVLDSMQGVIDVNEYRTEQTKRSLLEQAVIEGNFLAVKTLLEKYKANPNVPSSFRGIGMPNPSILSFARRKGDKVIIKLLLHYGAKE